MRNNRSPLNSNIISYHALKTNKQTWHFPYYFIDIKHQLTCLASPFPSFQGQHTQNSTFLQDNFPETYSIWTTSPGFKLLFFAFLSASCKAGPAAWLNARAIEPMDKFKFDPTEHTRLSAC